MANEVTYADIAAEEIEKDQYLVFSITNQEYAIQAMRFQEISEVSLLTMKPRCPC